MRASCRGGEPMMRASEDFTGHDAAAAIERLRKRLLDLTAKNRLLHFPHRPGSCLRIVDKLPDVIFERLMKGQEFAFQPVPDPPVDCTHAGRKPSATEYAAKLGIATSFDLPEPSPLSVAKASHHDQFLQTLHYSSDLDALTRRLANAARTAIEESGTNMLYLVLGFLEWVEEQPERQTRYAPLLIIPVSLTREKPQYCGAIKSCLEYTGEDVAVNPCLVEKLRQDFLLELPPLLDEDDPERYFSQIREVIARKPGWKLRRWATLCLLYFGKLLMYLDLDPKRWPPHKQIDKHPRVLELFGGVDMKPPTAIEEYNTDDPAIARELPPTVYDADSSQQGALIDVFRGRNLVIQGPPGTGKSQTITNLIAAALAKGKTVLFVSEKLAALEVVRRRLDEAGLGIFCLELHSHKTQKQQLLKELDLRLKQRNTFTTRADIDERLAVLDRNRNELISYVQLINSSFGSLGLTIFEILWARDRLRQGLPFPAAVVDTVVLQDVENLTVAKCEEQRQLLRIYGKHLTRILGTRSSLRSHPWCGLRNSALDHFDQQEVLTILRSCIRKCDELENVLDQCGPFLGLGAANSLAEIQQARGISSCIPMPSGKEAAELLSHLAEQEDRAVVCRFLSELDSFQMESSALSEKVNSWLRLDAGLRARLSQIAARTDELGISDWNAGILSDRVRQFEQASAAIRQVISLARAVLGFLDIKLTIGVQEISILAEVLNVLVERTPFDILPLRCPELEKEAAAAALRAAAAKAEQLRRVREELESEFTLEVITSGDELRGHLVAVDNAGFWKRCFGRRYRAARRYLQQIGRANARLKHSEMCRALRRLTTFWEGRANFRCHPCWNYLPGFDRDIDAPWNNLMRLLEWYAEVQARLPNRSGCSGSLRRALFRARTDALRQVQRLVQSQPDEFSTLRGFAEQTSTLIAALPPSTAISGETPLEAFAEALDLIVAELKPTAADLKSAGISETVPLRDIPDLLLKVERLEKQKNSIEQNSAVEHILGQYFLGLKTNKDAVAATLDLAERISTSSLPPAFKAWLFKAADLDKFKAVGDYCSELARHSDELAALWRRFENRTALDICRWFRLAEPLDSPRVDQLKQRAHEAIHSQAQLSEWVEYLRARAQVEQAKLAKLADLAEQGVIHPAHFAEAFNYSVHNSLARRALERHPKLMSFSGLAHNEIRRDFMRLDEEVLNLWRQQIAHLTDSRPVPGGSNSGPVSQWTDLALIVREINKKAKHIPIRQLILRAANALLALKPCFMMGPLSVAQYLPPGLIEFDLVLMDEASQLKPEDAIGAIARGQQIVIVGDPEQLPPTTFFERTTVEDDGSELDITAAEDGESILDVASSVWTPVRRLRWHYRSRHHTLIAFSNYHFYQNDLIVFPAAYASSRHVGVRYVFVEDGVYEGRRNMIEAQTVVEAVLDHMAQHPNESLGVATMNFEQYELIDELLDNRLRQRPPLFQQSRDALAQHYLEKWRQEGEPFFVKNLENVQGDERDVIFISMTYGRDSRGNFYQRFGPINGSTGHRRLNVLFTRARKRTVVFSSMDPHWIHVEPGSARGVTILRDYLEYARDGALRDPRNPRRAPESDFEVSVAQVLLAHGYDPVPQVGVAGFFIDIAVRHPRRDGTYILGIECDGASYHSARSVRDRDRLRQMILENLGWRIHRIWSADWYKHRQREVERLLNRIHEVLQSEDREEELERGRHQIERQWRQSPS